MRIRSTPQHYVVRYRDYQEWWDTDGCHGRGGPADVYYRRDDFEAACRHYGYSTCGPNALVEGVELLGLMASTLAPARVRYL